MNNSLEAIITLTALIAFITTILIGTIVLNENLREKQELLNTKNISNNCASIIDSFFLIAQSNLNKNLDAMEKTTQFL